VRTYHPRREVKVIKSFSYTKGSYQNVIQREENKIFFLFKKLKRKYEVLPQPIRLKG